MSSDAVTSPGADTKNPASVRPPKENESVLFYHLLLNMKDDAKKSIEWETVAKTLDYKDASICKIRFHQIMKQIGNSTADPAGSKTTTPKKTPKKAAKAKTDGIISPTAKVTKPRGRSAKAKKAAVAEIAASEDDEVAMKDVDDDDN